MNSGPGWFEITYFHFSENQMDRLFHVSDIPGTEVFSPRPARDGGHYVWAVGEARLHNYLVPRDCPRVTYYVGPETTAADQAKFFSQTDAEAVVAVEKAWLPAILSGTLYLYEFEPTPFRLHDDIARHYVTEQTVVPINCVKVTDILSELLARPIELRFMPSLWPLREVVIQSTLAFSIIRMRNAAPPENVAAYYPLP
jgi:hypothetical protein